MVRTSSQGDLPGSELSEFRSDAVELVRSGRSFASVARELGINQETLRHWVRSSERIQQLQGSGDASIRRACTT